MSLADALRGILDEDEPVKPRASSQVPKRLSAEAPGKYIGTPIHSPLPLLKTGKSSHPEFEPVKIYVRKETRKRAWRQWEDADRGDFSDLVQHLLEKYLEER